MLKWALIFAVIALIAGGLGFTGMAGAALFYASDALIGWERFVEARDGGHLAVMVTYHLGQILLVLSLV